MRRCDVIVVGGGAMGSSAAWWLARSGRDVVLLEQFEQGHVKGGSHGASRIFRLAHQAPDEVRMAQKACELWRELESSEGAELLTVTGGIDHGSKNDEVRNIASALETCGAAFEELSPDEASERFPGMRFEPPVVYQPDAGRANADATVAALQKGAARMGAELRFDEAATSIQAADDEAVVVTIEEKYIAPVAVVAAGSWAPWLLEDVPLPPISVTQEQPAYFRALRAGDAWPSFIHHRDPIEIYGLDTPGQGVKVGEHTTGPEVQPDHRTFRPEPSRLERLRAYVEEWFPGVDASQPLDVDTCLYDTTENERFFMERHGPLVVGTGFSGRGFKFVPLVGKILSDLATA